MRFKEINWYDLELAVMNEVMVEEKLPVEIVKYLADKFNCSKAIIQIAVHEFQEFIRKQVWCNKNGHLMVGDSYGDLEHGYDGAHCTRCGYSFSHILY